MVAFYGMIFFCLFTGIMLMEKQWTIDNEQLIMDNGQLIMDN